MRKLFICLFAALAPQVHAATDCAFDVECLEGEACSETQFTAQVVSADGNSLSLVTDAETLQGQMVASDDNLHYIFEAPSAAHLLTEYPDGAARYTIHMDGPFTITYHGTCKGTP